MDHAAMACLLTNDLSHELEKNPPQATCLCEIAVELEYGGAARQQRLAGGRLPHPSQHCARGDGWGRAN